MNRGARRRTVAVSGKASRHATLNQPLTKGRSIDQEIYHIWMNQSGKTTSKRKLNIKIESKKFSGIFLKISIQLFIDEDDATKIDDD